MLMILNLRWNPFTSSCSLPGKKSCLPPHPPPIASSLPHTPLFTWRGPGAQVSLLGWPAQTSSLGIYDNFRVTSVELPGIVVLFGGFVDCVLCCQDYDQRWGKVRLGLVWMCILVSLSPECQSGQALQVLCLPGPGIPAQKSRQQTLDGSLFGWICAPGRSINESGGKMIQCLCHPEWVGAPGMGGGGVTEAEKEEGGERGWGGQAGWCNY